MVSRQGSRQLCLIVISSLYCLNDAFTTTSRSLPLKSSPFINLQQMQQQQPRQQRQTPTQLFVDPTQVTDVLTTSSDVLLWQTQWLADAAAVAAETQQNGWWESWLNIFKSGLEFIHGVVDQPLRDMGFEQTWGVSIALFTFCTYDFEFCFKRIGTSSAL